MNLNDIREAVDKKYISLPIEFADAEGNEHVLNLRNFLRMGEAEQEKVDGIIKNFDGLEGMTEARAVFVDFLTTLSGDEKLAALFIKTIDSDLAVMMYIVQEYGKVTQSEKA